jgi:hypothetical protein
MDARQRNALLVGRCSLHDVRPVMRSNWTVLGQKNSARGSTEPLAECIKPPYVRAANSVYGCYGATAEKSKTDPPRVVSGYGDPSDGPWPSIT